MKSPGNYIYTKSGNKFDFVNPDAYFSNLPHSEFASEVAYSLSHLCRFNGHCERNYTVLHHTLLGYEVLTSMRHYLMGSLEFELTQDVSTPIRVINFAIVLWLLHDASESYLGDVCSPLKDLLPEYRKIEGETQDAIHTAYFLPRIGADCYPGEFIDALKIVRMVDMAMLCAEKKLLVSDMEEWPGLSTFLEVSDANKQMAKVAYSAVKHWMGSKNTSVYGHSRNGEFDSEDEKGNRSVFKYLLNVLNYPRSASGKFNSVSI